LILATHKALLDSIEGAALAQRFEALLALPVGPFFTQLLRAYAALFEDSILIAAQFLALMLDKGHQVS
jgi:hypothetical protein